MFTTKWWGGVFLGVLSLAVLGLFLLGSGHSQAEVSLVDTTLVSAASTNHPVEVFSVAQKASSIAEAFAGAGKDYYPEDRITSFPDPSLGIGTVITVQRALPITVVDGKKTRVIRTWASDVTGLLSEKNIQLGDEDRITPALSTPLSTKTSIQITRVARTTVSEFETVPFKTVNQDDSSLWRGQTEVVQDGKSGKLRKDYLLIREDGELKSKTLTGSEMVEKLINKIVKIGTKLKIGRTLTGKSTWYECCGTKVAMDAFKKGTEVRVTNLSNGKSIIVKVDGCICGTAGVLIDLHPSLFQQLGGQLGAGIMSNVRVEEVLN